MGATCKHIKGEYKKHHQRGKFIKNSQGHVDRIRQGVRVVGRALPQRLLLLAVVDDEALTAGDAVSVVLQRLPHEGLHVRVTRLHIARSQ